jgi:hypothetical protein
VVSKPAVTTPTPTAPATSTPTPVPATRLADAKPAAPNPETKVATTPETKPAVPAADTKVAATPEKPGTPADAKPTELAAGSPKPSPQSGILGPIAEAIKSQAKDQKASEPEADSKQLAEVTPDEESENPEDAKSTARFRRSPAEQFKIKGTMVAEFPQRLVIQYKQGKNRDPFATLIDESRTFDNPIADRIPNVEGLKLVGIIESAVGDNRGLFEDKNGYSYILKSGDKVQKGYVLRVERDRVYFQVFEYGWSRTVALTIE